MRCVGKRDSLPLRSIAFKFYHVSYLLLSLSLYDMASTAMSIIEEQSEVDDGEMELTSFSTDAFYISPVLHVMTYDL